MKLQNRDEKPANNIHVFDNGIKVFRKHLIPVQIERYKSINLHEPEEEEWFEKIIPFLRKAETPIFVDVGSAIGYYSILIKKNVPSCRIICYEPLKLHREYLSTNWRLNNLPFDDLNVREQAVYSSTGTLVFKEQLYGSRILNSKTDLKDKIKAILSRSREYNVRTVMLDDEINSYGHIDLLKIDVQGAETNVLQGGKVCLERGLIKCLIIGTHSKSIHEECLRLLGNFNYTIVFEDIETKLQPDGIIIATVNGLKL